MGGGWKVSVGTLPWLGPRLELQDTEAGKYFP